MAVQFAGEDAVFLSGDQISSGLLTVPAYRSFAVAAFCTFALDPAGGVTLTIDVSGSTLKVMLDEDEGFIGDELRLCMATIVNDTAAPQDIVDIVFENATAEDAINGVMMVINSQDFTPSVAVSRINRQFYQDMITFNKEEIQQMLMDKFPSSIQLGKTSRLIAVQLSGIIDSTFPDPVDIGSSNEADNKYAYFGMLEVDDNIQPATAGGFSVIGDCLGAAVSANQEPVIRFEYAKTATDEETVREVFNNLIFNHLQITSSNTTDNQVVYRFSGYKLQYRN